jgi:hypothetical protein
MTTLDFVPPTTRRNLALIRDIFVDLVEGDVVTAEFFVRAYGTFTITGPVRHTLSTTQWVVGGWYLCQGENNEPAKQLLGLTLVDKALAGTAIPKVTYDDLGQSPTG